MVYHLKACLQIVESVSVVCASSQLGTACCWPSTPRLLGRSWSGCVRSICCSLRLMGHFLSFAACSLTGTFIAKTSKVMGEFEVKSGSISRWHGSSQSDLDVHSYLKMYLLLKMVVFHCYVSLPEGRHGYSLQLFAVDMCWAMLVTCLRFCVPCCMAFPYLSRVKQVWLVNLRNLHQTSKFIWCPVSQTIPGWWFQVFLIFPPIWGRLPIWLIFVEGVETTN